MNIDFNNKYKFKIIGYYYEYIYKYTDYIKNINICNENILINKDFIIFITYKDKEDIKKKLVGIFTYNKFKNYIVLMNFINKKLKKIILKNKILIKEILINIWEYNFLYNKKLEIKEQKEKNRKLKIFNKKIEEIINFRFDLENYNNYKLQLLLKDLKKTLSVKIYTNNEDTLEDCIKHLFYLIKKWKGYNHNLLEKWILITIEKYKN